MGFIQGYQIWHFRVSNVKYTNTRIRKYTNTKFLKDQTCAIFEKHGIQGNQIWHSRVSNVKYTNTRLHKYANTQIQSA